MTFEQISTRVAELGALIANIRTQSNDGEDLMKATDLTGETPEAREAELTTLLNEYDELAPAFTQQRENRAKLAQVATDHATLSKPQNRLATPTAPKVEIKSHAKLRHMKNERNAFAFGQHILAMCSRDNRVVGRAEEWLRENGYEARTMNEGTNSAGGILVNDQIESEFIDLREEYGVARKSANVKVMTSDTMVVRRRAGGLSVYAVGETEAATESSKSWDSVNLIARDFAVLASFSQNLSDDAVINIADDLAGESAYAFANFEDTAFFLGDASGTYNGITGLTAAFKNLSATRENIAGAVVGAGNAWSELTLANHLSVAGKLPLYARKNAKWYCHATYYDTVMVALAKAAGGVTEADILNGYQNPRFLGYPVVFSQVLPATEANDDIPVFFGDLSKSSLFGDRKQTGFALDTSLGFKERVTWVQGFERFDVNHHDIGNQSASAGSRVVGPVTCLLTAAS